MDSKEFKQIASALSQFASTRETAEGAESYIGVQCNAGQFKLISGNENAGTIVTVGPVDSSLKFGYTIGAREFLQAAKVLTGKMDIELVPEKDKLTIKTSTGGKVVLKVKGVLVEAGFPKRPRTFESSMVVPAQDFERISKLLVGASKNYAATPKVARYEPVTVQLIDDVAHLVMVGSGIHAKYIHMAFEGEGPNEAHYGAHFDFYEAFKSLSADGKVQFGSEGYLAVSGNIELYTPARLVARWDYEHQKSYDPEHTPAWPVLEFKGVPETAFTMNKKALADAVKGVMPMDEHNRITFSVNIGSLAIAAYESKDGIVLPTETVGVGVRSVNANYLNDLLSAMDAKEVTIGWTTGQPALVITAQGYEAWTILLAPVAFR